MPDFIFCNTLWFYLLSIFFFSSLSYPFLTPTRPGVFGYEFIHIKSSLEKE